MIKSKKNTQKLYIELKASGKQVDKCFKQLNYYYSIPKTIKVLKAILEGVDAVTVVQKNPILNWRMSSISISNTIKISEDLALLSSLIL